MTPKHSQKHSHGGRKRTEGEASARPRGESADQSSGDFDLEEAMNAEYARTSTEGAEGAAPATDEEQAQPAAGAQADEIGRQPVGAGADAELQDQRDRYLRLAAEYDNYRKRTERERTESWSRAQGQIVERLLDVIDDLERVASVDPEKTSVASVLEGVQLVERKLLRALESSGLEVLDAEGQPFDPEVHEAIATAPAEERDADNTIANVFQKGYLFKGNLLRPARVRVYQHGD